jgi:hypothetical protein
VLQSYVDDSTLAAQLLEEEEAREEAERAAAERAVDLALSMHSALSLSSDAPTRSNSGGSVSLQRVAAAPPESAGAGPPANASAGGGPPENADCGQPESSGTSSKSGPDRPSGSGSQGRTSGGSGGGSGRPGIAGMSGSGLSRSVVEGAAGGDDERAFATAFVPRYLAYLDRARRKRLRPDGTLTPLPAGDAWRQEYAWLINIGCIQQPSGVAYTTMTTNLETGLREAPPDDMASRAVRGLKLRWVQWVRVGGGCCQVCVLGSGAAHASGRLQLLNHPQLLFTHSDTQRPPKRARARGLAQF